MNDRAVFAAETIAMHAMDAYETHQPFRDMYDMAVARGIKFERMLVDELVNVVAYTLLPTGQADLETGKSVAKMVNSIVGTNIDATAGMTRINNAMKQMQASGIPADRMGSQMVPISFAMMLQSGAISQAWMAATALVGLTEYLKRDERFASNDGVGFNALQFQKGLYNVMMRRGMQLSGREEILAQLDREYDAQAEARDPEAAKRARAVRLEEAMGELNDMIGLKDVKKDVADLISLTRYRAVKAQLEMGDAPASMHLVFTGNPGTGKTTIARVLGKVYKELGLLKKGHFVEVSRSDLVAGYVGQTAEKTKKVIEQAKGGVLFIDEAYSLAPDLGKDGKDFGSEAIETLLKAMEDNRDNLVVIVAGYPDLMKKFINANPGLQSRFNKYVDFPDYNGKELGQIVDVMLKSRDFSIDEDARRQVTKLLDGARGKTGFGNGRTVRNLLDKLEQRVAFRVEKSGLLDKPADTDAEKAALRAALSTITPADVVGVTLDTIKAKDEAAEKTSEGLGYIGFIPPSDKRQPAPGKRLH